MVVSCAGPSADHVALHSHAFDVMSFLPEVTSQPSHISACDIMTRSLVSSAQPCTGQSSKPAFSSWGNTINRHSTRDFPVSSSSSTFASFIVADIVSLFGQLLSQMPHRLPDDLFLAVLVSPETVFLLHSAASSVYDFGLPRVHVLMSLVIETDHPCTQLISGRDDILPWVQVGQP